MALTTAERTNLIKLTVAMFNAAPGATYLAELTNFYEANGRSLSALAQALATTPAYKSINPVFQTAAEFATSFLTPYGLQANAEAIAYITAKFNAGLSKGQIALDAGAALDAYAGTDAALVAAKAIQNNKTEVAEYYSVTKGIAQTNLGTLQTAISTVTSAASSVTAAKTSIDGGSGGFNGTAYVLTTGADNIPGTTGNDSISGVVSGTATQNTLDLADQIDGSAGTDTLTAILSGANFAGSSIKNVEVIKFKALSSQSASLSGVTGATDIYNSGSTAGTTLTVTAAAAAAIGVESTTGVTDVTFADAAFAAGGTLGIKLSAAGSLATDASIKVGQTTGTGAATALSIDASGTNYLTLVTGTQKIAAANAIKTLTVTGTGSVKIASGAALLATTLAADLTKVDASANSGGLTMQVDNTKIAFTGGSGNDVLTVNGALVAGASVALGAGTDKLLNGGSGSLTSAVTVDGGDGVDTVAVSLINAGNASVFKNFESVDLGGIAANFDIALLTGSTITGLTMNSAPGGSYTVSNIAATNSGLTVGGAITANATTTTLSVTGAATNTADVFTVTFAGDAVVATPSAANVIAGTLALANIETINIVSEGGANTWNAVTVTDDALANMTITGSKNLDLAVTAQSLLTGKTTLALTKVDGSAATGKLAITTNNNTGTFVGGTANDTFTTGNQATTLTGSAGSDSFKIASTLYAAASNGATTAYTPTAKAFTTITDFSKGDSITFKDQGTETFSTTKVDVSAATTLATALGIAASSTDGSTNGAIKWFQYAGNTYLVEVNTNNATVTDAAATDIVVKLNGVIDLSTLTGAGTNVLTASV